jgi:phage gpG-like protein
VTLQVVDLNAAITFLDKAQAEIERGDFAPAMAKCSIALVSSIKMNFARGQGPDGKPWPRLKLARPRGGDKPLRDKGILMAAATATGAPGNVQTITRTSLVQGTNLDHADTHQNGKTIVGRPALAIPLTREAGLAGRPRNFPRRDKLVLIWPRGKSSGALVEMVGKGKRARQVRHFLLVRKVTIPARPFIGWNDGLANTCGRIVADHLGLRFEEL